MSLLQRWRAFRRWGEIGQFVECNPQAIVRRGIRKGDAMKCYGWEISMPDGNNYFSMDLLSAIRYAKGGTNPYFATDSRISA